MAFRSLPVNTGSFPATIGPFQVLANGLLLLIVAFGIGIVQRELIHGHEVTFDAVQPRGIGGCPIELEFVGCRMGQHFGCTMATDVVQRDVQRARISTVLAKPLRNDKNVLQLFFLAKRPRSLSRSISCTPNKCPPPPVRLCAVR